MRSQALLIGALLLGACSAEAPHAPGTLQVRLETADTTLGATVFTISGAEVGTMHVASGIELHSYADGAGTHVVLLGDLGAGTIATIEIPDATLASRYAVQLSQVADRNTFALLDTARERILLAIAQ